MKCSILVLYLEFVFCCCACALWQVFSFRFVVPVIGKPYADVILLNILFLSVMDRQWSCLTNNMVAETYMTEYQTAIFRFCLVDEKCCWGPKTNSSFLVNCFKQKSRKVFFGFWNLKYDYLFIYLFIFRLFYLLCIKKDFKIFFINKKIAIKKTK